MSFSLLPFQYDGSLVVAPIVTPRGEVVGTFSVDTLTNDKEVETSIGTHEINFYEVTTG